MASAASSAGVISVGLNAGIAPLPFLTMYSISCGGSFVRADNGLFAGPRVGFEAGSQFRFRIALEFYRAFSDRVRTTGEEVGSFSTTGFWIGGGYQL